MENRLQLFALGIAFLPVPPAFIFLAYLFTEVLTCTPAIARYVRSRSIDRKEDKEDIESFSPSSPEKVAVDITIRFKGSNHAILVTLDDGAFIALDPDEQKQQLITDNYELIKKLATSVEYQYVLNMNFTKIIVDRST